MNSYSQNGEDLFILNYFKDYKGIVLDIGANDGVTFSNSKLLIENGWKSHLIEPSYACDHLALLYMTNRNTRAYKIAIGAKNGFMTLHESGAHVPGGSDMALVSSLKETETTRWKERGVEYAPREVEVQTFKTWMKKINCSWTKQFDFISIDVEGFEWPILKQIDLTAVGCQALCIEYNGHEELRIKFTKYCQQFDLKLEAVNKENLIFVR